MEQTIEHGRGKKEGEKMMQKKLVHNHKCVMLPHELVGANGTCLTQCGRAVEEKSIIFWKGRKIDSKKTNKGSRKVWEDFAQWV